MSHVKGKEKNQILEELVGTAEPTSVVHEQQKMAIIVRCTEDLEKALGSLEESMNANAKSREDLTRKIYFLNWIATIATIVFPIVAVLIAVI